MRPTVLRRLSIVAVAAFAAACSTGAPNESAAAGESVRVAVLLTGPKNGGAWDRAGVAGLDQVAADLDVEVRYAESVDLGTQVEAFSDFAERNYDLIIGHSDAFRDGAIEAAAKYPDVWFVSTGTGTEGDEASLPPNFVAVALRENEIGYLSGYAAGVLTETDKVAWVGSLPLIGIGQALEGHKLGVRDANSDAEVLETFVGSFVDAAKAKEAALGLVSSGADVITHNADLAGLGVLEAAREQKVPALGHSLDQSDQAPEVVVSSVTLDFREAYGSIVEELIAGNLTSGSRSAGVSDGVVGLAPLRNVDDEARSAIEARLQAIADGSFVVPDVTFVP